MRTRALARRTLIPRLRDEVFAFFADAGNLETITPPWLRFRILTPRPIAMRAGTCIEYRLVLRGAPIRWESEITDWAPPARFVDRQVRGPYRLWVHEHVFEQTREGTLMSDRVDYAVPGGLLEPLVHRLVVGPELQRIFDFRERRCLELLGRPGDGQHT